MTNNAPRFDVSFGIRGASIDFHYCREWENDDLGCYGFNPNHGFTFDEAKQEMINWYENQVEYWKTLTYKDWNGDEDG